MNASNACRTRAVANSTRSTLDQVAGTFGRFAKVVGIVATARAGTSNLNGPIEPPHAFPDIGHGQGNRYRHPRVFSLNEVVQGKARWGVSVAALNYSLHRLGATTEWQYRQFCIQIAKRYNNGEPDGRERETSAVWKKIFEDLRAQRLTRTHIATELAVPTSEIDNPVFRLSNIQSIEGGS